jgi:hypothetical protein
MVHLSRRIHFSATLKTPKSAKLKLLPSSNLLFVKIDFFAPRLLHSLIRTQEWTTIILLPTAL